MVSKVLSATVIGLEAQLVQVEVHFSREKSRFYIVGLPDKSCSESKERVSAIIKNFLGKRLPAGTFTVNLAPADILKSGPVYDLPIALGILQELGYLQYDQKENMVIGELSLDGKTRHTKGILPIADLVRKKKIMNLYLPNSNAKEAAIIPNIKVYPVKTLNQLVEHFRDTKRITPFKRLQNENNSDKESAPANDFKYIKGQEHAKRAATIAAAGSHNLLMTGSPGSGKSMLAKSIPTILPRLTLEESLEVTRIYSVSNLLSKSQGLISRRPFRKPHHTISHVALVGGGSIPQPGEISLCHRGILFLDEFSEFSGKTLEALRQPLEDGVITISRAKGTITFPAKIMLVAAMNPCRCGWLGDDKKECKCSRADILKYNKKISGPLLDRIDMQISLKRISYEKLKIKGNYVTSAEIQKDIQKAREIQEDRYKNFQIFTNSEMRQRDIEKFITLNQKSKSMLKQAVESLNLSARTYFRILRVARTIADLKGNTKVSQTHIAEALSFRINEEI